MVQAYFVRRFSTVTRFPGVRLLVVSTLTPGGVEGENNLNNGKAKRTSFPVSMSMPRSADGHISLLCAWWPD